MIKLKCPKCGSVRKTVRAHVVVTFGAPAVGIIHPDWVEIGIMARVCTEGLEISIDQLKCESCGETSPDTGWGILVFCACGKLVREMENEPDNVLGSIFCQKYKSHLCKDCWQTAGCEHCRFANNCRLREVYGE